MDALIELRQVTKHYKTIRAMDDVSLRIGRGVTGLLGPNGAGKTTLIKVVLGLVKLTSGKGTVLGFDLEHESREIRDNVGYMPEDDCYIAGLSGIEALQFAARLSGLPKVEALRRAHEILDFCGAEQERYRIVDTYSSGMRQKLKFAQAIVHDPQLLILDEPTAGLDPQERQAMLNRIRILAEKAGKSVIISTHILPDVQATCENVTIMGRGRLLLSETLEELSRPTSPSYTVRVHGDPRKLANRIHESGVPVEVFEDGTLQIEGISAENSNRILEWAEQAGVGIRKMTPARNTLEDVFLKTVQDANRDTKRRGERAHS